jgi:hypothetical protein
MDQFERFKKMAKDKFNIDIIKSNNPSSFEELFGERENLRKLAQPCEATSMIEDISLESARSLLKEIDILIEKHKSGNICDWAFYESFNQIKERYGI